MGQLTGRHVRCTPSRNRWGWRGDERGKMPPLHLVSLPSWVPVSPCPGLPLMSSPPPSAFRPRFPSSPRRLAHVVVLAWPLSPSRGPCVVRVVAMVDGAWRGVVDVARSMGRGGAWWRGVTGRGGQGEVEARWRWRGEVDRAWSTGGGWWGVVDVAGQHGWSMGPR